MLTRIFRCLWSVCLLAVVAEAADLHSRAFADDPELTAQSGQAILLDWDTSTTQTARYQLAKGLNRVCVDGTASHLLVTLSELSTNHVVMRINGRRGQRCARGVLESGLYTVTVSVSDASVEKPERVVVGAAGTQGAALVNANGTVRPGFWALVPNPLYDPGQHNRQGAVRVSYALPSIPVGELYADYASSHFDFNSLFQLPVPNTKAPGSAQPMVQSLGSHTGCWYSSQLNPSQTPPKYWLVVSRNCAGNPQATMLRDLGNYMFIDTQGQGANGTFPLTVDKTVPYGSASDYLTLGTSVPENEFIGRSTYTVAFRWVVGPQTDPLQDGEAELTQGSGETQASAIFSFDYDASGTEEKRLADLDSPSLNLITNTRFLHAGNNVLATWYENGGLNGTTSDYGFPNGFPGERLFLTPLDSILGRQYDSILNNNCSGCRLRNTAISNVQLTQWNFEKADFSGARLSHVSFHGATLTSAKFVSAILTCVDFSGADANHLTDLASADFTNATVVDDGSCSSNFSYTNLSGAQMPGATLQGASFDHANLSGANLTGAGLNSSSLRFANLTNAVLYGSDLSNTNLDQANLSGAFLQEKAGAPAARLSGSFLRNVNLSQAQIGAADFANANFFSSAPLNAAAPCGTWSPSNCASATGAALNNADFAGAYLAGVDFGSATISGANFSNAYLVGANFAKAQIAGINFASAFLQGANLSAANITGNASFGNAFVDFAGLQGIYFVLDGRHTVFPGYWNTPGAPDCIFTAYKEPTAAPPSNGLTICPDGRRYPGANGNSPAGCGPAMDNGSRWISPVAFGQFGTYAAATPPTAACSVSTFDTNWNDTRSAVRRPRSR